MSRNVAICLVLVSVCACVLPSCKNESEAQAHYAIGEEAQVLTPGCGCKTLSTQDAIVRAAKTFLTKAECEQNRLALATPLFDVAADLGLEECQKITSCPDACPNLRLGFNTSRADELPDCRCQNGRSPVQPPDPPADSDLWFVTCPLNTAFNCCCLSEI